MPIRWRSERGQGGGDGWQGAQPWPSPPNEITGQQTGKRHRGTRLIPDSDCEPRHAGVASAGVVAGRGNNGGQKLLGFRSGRGTADAIGQSFLMLSRKDSATWVLEGDIRGCFDNISHEWLLTHVPTDKEVLHKWLKAGFMENRTLFPTEAGTPQGGIISPTLANLTLDGLEPLLKQHFPRKYANGKTICPKINLIRYADDFIITGATKECWKMKSGHWSSSSCATGACSSRQRKPASRISRKGSTSSDKTSASMTAS